MINFLITEVTITCNEGEYYHNNDVNSLFCGGFSLGKL